ncbi:MAG: type IIA DNA topoisomerase subunit B, partial [Paramuribaculum sp.]|nr:type IIA DNA topoisomerase subunit B [Paramuribaculum sp.]
MAQTDEDDLYIPIDNTPTGDAAYNESDIVTLSWNEHIRQRPGMYISQLGDGTMPDDGIYVLFKEVMDNSIDEFVMGFGRRIDVQIADGRVSVRDYGRGIPLGKLVDASSKMNTGARFGSDAFKKSVGLNGVGIKAVNAMSVEFVIRCVRDGNMKEVVYSKGELVSETPVTPTTEENGTFVSFVPDASLFQNYRFIDEFIIHRIKNYTYLNIGLSIFYNNKRYYSKNGLIDLLNDSMTGDSIYPVLHFKTDDAEIAVTHARQYGEEYYSFVNGQHTIQGGTPLTAFKDAYTRTVKDFYGRNFEPSDIRNGIVAAISVRVQDPLFDSQAKVKLTGRDMMPDGPTIAKYLGDFIKRDLDNTLHRERELADALLKQIQESERERKSMAGV